MYGEQWFFTFTAEAFEEQMKKQGDAEDEERARLEREAEVRSRSRNGSWGAWCIKALVAMSIPETTRKTLTLDQKHGNPFRHRESLIYFPEYAQFDEFMPACSISCRVGLDLF